MRIAILAPIWERVPPPGYGGIELVVSLLTEGLVEAGHDVTLYASGDSLTSADLRAFQPRALRTEGISFVQAAPYELDHVHHCFVHAAEFDLIHNHMAYQGCAFAPFVQTPVVTTLHGPFDQHNRMFFEHHAAQPYVSISRAQRVAGPPGLNYVGNVYNGIDTRRYHLASRKGGYLLNLGRISPEKGTHLAVQAARRTRTPLIIAGKIDPADEAYFRHQVEPWIDGELVRYIGEVGGQAKADLLARAEALVHPVQWPEPFGLVMAEALASGTPVIAFPLGSVPELIEPGVTGLIVDSLDGLCRAIEACRDLDPAACRRSALERFDARRMVAGYLGAYERVLAGPRITIERSASTTQARPRSRPRRRP